MSEEFVPNPRPRPAATRSDAPGRRPPPDVSQAAELAVRELILAGEKYRRAATGYLQVTVSESQAISYLTARGPTGLTELATALDMTTGAVTTMVDRLEGAGLARRRPHPTDRRRLTVELTAQARRRVAATRPWLQAAIAQAAGDDLPAFLRIVEGLAAGLTEQAGRALHD